MSFLSVIFKGSWECEGRTSLMSLFSFRKRPLKVKVHSVSTCWMMAPLLHRMTGFWKCQEDMNSVSSQEQMVNNSLLKYMYYYVFTFFLLLYFILSFSVQTSASPTPSPHSPPPSTSPSPSPLHTAWWSLCFTAPWGSPPAPHLFTQTPAVRLWRQCTWVTLSHCRHTWRVMVRQWSSLGCSLTKKKRETWRVWRQCVFPARTVWTAPWWVGLTEYHCCCISNYWLLCRMFSAFMAEAVSLKLIKMTFSIYMNYENLTV